MGAWYDADTGAGQTVDVTSWLRPVAGPPILVVEPPPSMDARPGGVTIRRVEAGPPPVLRVDGPAGPHRLAPSADGGGVWVSEHRGRTRRSLREQGLDGRTRRSPRAIPCGVEPLLETPLGLWVSRWVNIYTLAGREVDFTEPTYALLDPRTLREKASYPEALVMGAYHALTMDDQEHDVMLRDLRTRSAMPLTKPASGSARPATTRRSSILWVLDLSTGGWQHMPGMPVYGGLKFSSEAWAPDGRLVMLGYYGVDKRVLATWRPGDPQVAVRPDPLPEALYEAGLLALLVAG